jgi:N-(2-amino-2-carboxyethyl)-L-glutamate synthase
MTNYLFNNETTLLPSYEERLTHLCRQVGNTPLSDIIFSSTLTHQRIISKLELKNPSGSMKDRVAVQVIYAAYQKGIISPTTTIIESTSGNFGIALAYAGAILGNPVICVVDPLVPTITKKFIEGFGGILEMVESADATGSYLSSRIAKRDQLLGSIQDSWTPDQYTNPINK